LENIKGQEHQQVLHGFVRKFLTDNSRCGQLSQKNEERNDERKTKHGHQGGIVAGSRGYGTHGGEKKRIAGAAQKDGDEEQAIIGNRVAYHDGEKPKGEHRKQQDEQEIVNEFGYNDRLRINHPIVVEKSTFRFAEKGVSNGIDRAKENNQPKNNTPDGRFDAFERVAVLQRKINQQNRGENIKQNTSEYVFIAKLDEYIFD
jgi:hypothetical protein